MKSIIKIISKQKLLGIIIKAGFQKQGIDFFTPPEFSQQLAYMQRTKGYVITPHIHSQVKRSIKYTKETLFIKSGKVRIDFYDEKKNYLESRVLQKGDVVLLAFGGHGLEFIKDSEIIEVKQGPFISKAQPQRFVSIAKNKLRVKK